MSAFTYLHLRADEGDWPALAEVLGKRIEPVWRDAGQSVWGIWQGLFGVAANELLVILAGPHNPDLTRCLDGIATVVERRPLVATARPGDSTPCTRAGLYVFRRFEVDHADIDEAVNLSREAWQTFEVSDHY